MTLYAHTTLQNLVDQLSQELNDSSQVFFTASELQDSIVESLHLWNVLTGYHRTTEFFNTTAGTAFYDLTAEFSSQLSSTVTDRDILGTMQYRLIEPYDPIDSTGLSEMFTHASLVRSIQQRRDRFLAETEHEITRKAAIEVDSGDGIVPLDDTTIAVMRAVWKTRDNHYFTLSSPSDEPTASAMSNGWQLAPGIPSTWSITFQPNLLLQLIPPPANPGQLLLMTVETGSDLDTTAGSNGTVLGIHDDVAWGIGWSALEDQLLRDGIGRDPERAQYCAGMTALSVDLARSMPTVLGVTINGQYTEPTSLHMLDTMRSGWEGRNTDVPTTAAILGDWLALYPVPDDIYSIGVTFVSKSPTLALTDNVQLGREQLSAIIGWSKQLIQFKQQGVQLQQGIQAGGALIEQARLYNEQRIMRSQYLCETFGLTNDITWHPARQAQGKQSEDGSGDPRDTASSRQSRGRNAVYSRPRKRLGGR